MVRAAAKNHEHVGVVVSRPTTARVLDELRRDGSLSRRHPAAGWPGDAFAHTAGYDAAIVEWLDERESPPPGTSGADRSAIAALLPPTIHLTLERAGSLRYGENPHQHGARYRIAGAALVVGRRGPARGQGALVPQHLRCRRGVAPGPRAARRRWRPTWRWPSSSTPTRAARRSMPTWPTPTSGPSSAIPLSAFGGVVAIGGPVTGPWPRPSPPDPRPT